MIFVADTICISGGTRGKDSAQDGHVDQAKQTGGSRRSVLAGLVGLGALLPTTETAGKNRNERRHKRKERRRKKAPSVIVLNVAVLVYNQRSSPVFVREWTWDDGGKYGIGLWKAQGWRKLPAKPTSGPDPFFDFVRDEDEVVVELSTGDVIDATNPTLGFPHVTLWAGKWPEQGLDKTSTWEKLLDTGLEVNERRTVGAIQVQRLSDSSDHKRFQVTLV